MSAYRAVVRDAEILGRAMETVSACMGSTIQFEDIDELGSTVFMIGVSKGAEDARYRGRQRTSSGLQESDFNIGQSW